jgi:hypothetical protein
MLGFKKFSDKPSTEEAAARLAAVHRDTAKFETELKVLSKQLKPKELWAVGHALYGKKFNFAKDIKGTNDMVAAFGRQRRRTEDIAAA